MRIQQVTKRDGVRERYIAGVGATPVLRTYRVSSAALVAPTPALPAIQKISGADTGHICAGYETDQLHSHRRLTNDPNLIHRRTL